MHLGWQSLSQPISVFLLSGHSRLCYGWAFLLPCPWRSSKKGCALREETDSEPVDALLPSAWVKLFERMRYVLVATKEDVLCHSAFARYKLDPFHLTAHLRPLLFRMRFYDLDVQLSPNQSSNDGNDAATPSDGGKSGWFQFEHFLRLRINKLCLKEGWQCLIIRLLCQGYQAIWRDEVCILQKEDVL